MELMVVIAIIGIFASIVLVPLNNARNKSKNASAKTSMSDIRIFANIFHIDNGYSYDNGTDDVCDAPQITVLRTAAEEQTGNLTDCSSSPSAYAAWVELRSLTPTTYFCVDSEGFAGEITTAPTTEACQ